MGGGNIKQDSSYRLVSDINITTWNNKANSNHAHNISQITNLQSTLDGKAASSHTHGWDSIIGNIKVPDKAGTIALIGDLNMKGTWGTDGMMWFPGFNLVGMGYVIIIPVINKAVNIAVSSIQIFNGQIWQDTTLLDSDIKANQFIGVCENSNISGIEYGRVYLTRALIDIS
ncbi:MAG TPA: hypothetical protein DCW90_02360 [Lachnospiraceae bacterium]|nr:hypothetical protein [Lachnospiraceae bacterium]